MCWCERVVGPTVCCFDCCLCAFGLGLPAWMWFLGSRSGIDPFFVLGRSEGEAAAVMLGPPPLSGRFSGFPSVFPELHWSWSLCVGGPARSALTEQLWVTPEPFTETKRASVFISTLSGIKADYSSCCSSWDFIYLSVYFREPERVGQSKPLDCTWNLSPFLVKAKFLFLFRAGRRKS